MYHSKDAYEKLDPELLDFVEDVIFNRRDDPKSKPTAVKKSRRFLAAESQNSGPVPEYKPYKGALPRSAAFALLEKSMSERVIMIDGATGSIPLIVWSMNLVNAYTAPSRFMYSSNPSYCYWRRRASSIM